MFFTEIEVQTSKRFEFVNLDRKVQEIIEDFDFDQGLAFLFCPHTTAGLVCNENDPSIQQDFAQIFDKLVPLDLEYEHIGEGKNNARAHQLAMLLGNHLVVPVKNKRLNLGTWQSLFLVELLEPRKRKVFVSLI
jgi:secondary thiamine-phosphate synthase enzyme